MAKKGSQDSSPRATADRHFTSESARSLPPARVCTPPAHGEGAILRASYTSSSSDTSDRTPPPRLRGATVGATAAPRQEALPHWHSSPADGARAAAFDAARGAALDQEPYSRRGGFRTPELAATLQRSCSASPGPPPHSCPHCPDSEARLDAARNAVMDLMHRLTDATEDRDEALEAAAREWQLAELLRQQLAGTPGHAAAEAASSCGRPSSGLRSSRLPHVQTPDRFDADWDAARRDLAAQQGPFLTPHSSFATPRGSFAASPAQQPQRRRQSGGSSPAWYSPAQQLSPPAPWGLFPEPQTAEQQSGSAPAPRRRSPAQRRLDDGSGAAWQTPPRRSNSMSSPLRFSPAATASPAALTPEQAALREERGERSPAEERAAELEDRLRAADGVIWRLLSEPHALQGGTSTAEIAAELSGRLCTGSLKAAAADAPAAAHRRSGSSSASADDLLQRLQKLAAQAADASDLSGDGGGSQRGNGNALRHSGEAQQLSGSGRRHRLSSALQEAPAWPAAGGDADAAGDAAAAVPAAETRSSARRPPPPDGSPLAKMHAAVAQLDAAARRVSTSASRAASPAASCDTCSLRAEQQHAAGATRVALKRARMDMVAAERTLGCRKAEALRLLSPSKLQPQDAAN